MKNIFLEIVGAGATTKVIEYLLDLTEVDVTIKDVCDATSLSRPTVDQILIKCAWFELVKTRRVGRSTLYKLNTESKIVASLMKLNEVVIEYAATKNNIPPEFAKHFGAKYTEMPTGGGTQ